MAQQDGSLSDENVHVKELKRLFLTSGVDRNGYLTKEGLQYLCEKLNLNDFSASIVERVLSKENTVNFKQFKDRFLMFLPEIIDLASGNADSFLVAAFKTCTTLGFNDTQRLTKYEMRVVCEGTPGLNTLSVAEINAIFASVAKSSRCSLSDFTTCFRNGPKNNGEVHFIGETYRISSMNLFEHLDNTQSDEIDKTTLIEFLTACGMKIEDCVELIESFDDESSSTISLSIFSKFLETNLASTVNTSNLPVKAAILCLNSLVENTRCNLKEYELRCEHMQKQLQVANQRRTLLIEELDQNQQSIEASYNNRLREMEDRCRQKINLIEEKFRAERQAIQDELENIESDLSRVRHNETFLKNKLCVLERHNKRLTLELEEQILISNNTEQKNRELRTELNKKTNFRTSEENSRLAIWKQKVELLVDHNKKLRERMEEMQKTHKRNDEENDLAFVPWTTPFRSQLMIIRKRRMQRGDTLSEMDSEPESIFYRRRRKRLVKKRDRQNIYEKIHSLQSTKRHSYKIFKPEDSISEKNPAANSSVSTSSEKMKRTFSSYSRVGEVGSQQDSRVLLARNKDVVKAVANKNSVFQNLSDFRPLQPTTSPRAPDDSMDKFFSLIEKYRKVPEISSNETTNSLGTEKKKMTYTKPLSPCSKCCLCELKINELMSILDGKRKEGSIEDPMPHSSLQGNMNLQEEVGQLKMKLMQALLKAGEIRSIYIAPQTSRLQSNGMNHLVNLSTSTRVSPRSFADFQKIKTEVVQDPSQSSHVYRFS